MTKTVTKILFLIFCFEICFAQKSQQAAEPQNDQVIDPRVKPKTEKEMMTEEDYKSYVSDVVYKNKKDVDACKKKTKPQNGKMTLVWVIDQKGKPNDFLRGPDTVENGDLYHCLVKKMEKWKFKKPPMDSRIDVQHTFSF